MLGLEKPAISEEGALALRTLKKRHMAECVGIKSQDNP